MSEPISANAVVGSRWREEYPDASPVEALLIVEYMDGDGKAALSLINTGTSWTALGMLEAARAWMRQDFLTENED